MMPEDSDFLAEIHRYLRQQRELYGDGFYLDRLELPVERPVMDLQTAETEPMFESMPSCGSEPWLESNSLEEMYSMVCKCVKCPLGLTRKKFVFGVGDPGADVVLIGEAPGADEDAQGEPFVGRAGQLLNKILASIGFKREEVYICNILKCRPPNNRDPLPSETEQCEPYLHHQLRLLQPKIILALGRIAGQTLLRTNATLGSLRSSVHSYQDIPMMVTYHPAALLRNPQWKVPTWEDVQKFRAMYDSLRAKNS
jgi:DNA polymerase